MLINIVVTRSGEVHEPSWVASCTLLIFSLIVVSYFFFCGTLFGRLWYYQGILGPPPQRFYITPQYRKKPRRRPQSRTSEPRGRETSSASSQAGNSDITDDGNSSNNAVQIIVEDLDNVFDPEIRARLAEERRISRLSTFVQDDCGDGSEFPNITHATVPVHEQLASLKAYPDTRRPNYTNYHTMGLRRLDNKDWLTIDNTYSEFTKAREWLLTKKHDEVIQVKSEGEAACEELLHEVVNFLVAKYPQFFKKKAIRGQIYIRNEFTSSEYCLQRPWDCHPLELCARLAMEDFNIIMKGDFTQQHYLKASATLFPAGWVLCERIGKSITSLHDPVPRWADRLSRSVEHYFSRLSETSSMERSSFFIQVRLEDQTLADFLFVQNGKDFFPEDMSKITPSNIFVRQERQTFRKLPKSGAIVFSVKTNVQKLTELSEEQRNTLAKEISSWPEDIAWYKGRHLWGDTLLGFCDQENESQS